MSGNILPCPFCGGPAQHNDGGNSVYGRLWWYVGCEACGVGFGDPEVWDKDRPGMLDPEFPPKTCFAVWNTRTPSDAKSGPRFGRNASWDE